MQSRRVLSSGEREFSTKWNDKPKDNKLKSNGQPQRYKSTDKLLRAIFHLYITPALC